MTRAPLTHSASWSTSLETWARTRHGDRVLVAPSTLDFAPTGTLRPQTFYDLPVVMTVMTRRTLAWHPALTSAAEIIREATYGFRAVAVTDVPAEEAVRAVDWAVEHLLGEDEWAALQESNWLPAAVDHLEWARRTYGASLVIAPEGPDQVLEEISRLGAFADAPEEVLAAALERARESMPEVRSEVGVAGRRGESGLVSDPETGAVRGMSVEHGLRGWWQQAAADGMTRCVSFGEQSPSPALEVTVRAGDGAGSLIGLERDGERAPELEAALRSAAAHGWSAVTIRPSGAATSAAAGPVGGAGRSADVETDRRLTRAAVCAGAESVDASGPTLLLIPEEAVPMLEIDDGLEGVDGTVTLRPGRADVVMAYGASTRCPPEALPGVLEEIRRIHLTSAL